MPNVHKICRASGIKLKPRRCHGTMTLPPKVTYSRGTIVQLAKLHGEDHVSMVLEAIISTPHNETQLFSDVIKGVSHWLVVSRFETRDSPLVNEYLATIILSVLHEQVRSIDLPHRGLRMAQMLIASLQEDVKWQVAA